MARALKAKTVIIAAGLAMAFATGALAAPREAVVAGPVLDVPEAGVIRVALGPLPEQWVRVRLAGGEQLDRKRLMAAAFAKRVECVPGERGRWSCRLGDEDLAALAGAPETGLIAAAWR